MEKFFKQEDGQALTEYALATVFITFAGFGFYVMLKEAYKNVFEKILNSLQILSVR